MIIKRLQHLKPRTQYFWTIGLIKHQPSSTAPKKNSFDFASKSLQLITSSGFSTTYNTTNKLESVDINNQDLDGLILKHLNSSQPNSLEVAWKAYDKSTRYQRQGEVAESTLRELVNKLIKKEKIGDNKWGFRLHEILKDQFNLGRQFPKEFYLAALTYFQKHDMVEEALQMFENLKLYGITMDINGYNVLFEMLSKDENFNMIKHYFKELLEWGLNPDSQSIYWLVDSYVSTGELDQAVELMTELSDKYQVKVLEKSYLDVIKGFYKINRLEEGLKVFNNVREIYRPLSVEGYLTGIKFFSLNYNSTSMIIELFEELKANNLVASNEIYLALIYKFVKQGNFRTGLRYFSEYTQSTLNYYLPIYDLILKCYISLGKLNEAMELFESMRSMTQNVNKVGYVDASCYTQIIKAYLDADKLDMVNLLVKQMQSDNIAINTYIYNLLINFHMNNGQVNQAIEYFQQLLALPNGTPSLNTYRVVIKGFLDIGQVDEAMHAYYHSKNQFLAFTAKQYNSYIRQLCQIGQMGLANKILLDMVNSGLNATSETYSILLTGYSKQKNLDQVKNLHRQIKMDTNLDPDIVLWSALINAYNHCNLSYQSLQIYDMISYMEVPITPATVSIILDTCAYHDHYERFHQIFNSLRAQEFPLDLNNYISYLEGLCRFGETDDAIRLLTVDFKQLGLIPDKKVLGTVIDALNKLNLMEDQRTVKIHYLKDSFPELRKTIDKLATSSF